MTHVTVENPAWNSTSSRDYDEVYTTDLGA